MLLYRALNKIDIALNPIKEGLYAKGCMYDNIFDLLCFLNIANNLNCDYNALKEIAKTYSEKYAYYVLDDVKYSACKENDRVKNLFKDFDFTNVDDLVRRVNLIGNVTSTVNDHFINGNRHFTKWISFTSDIHCIDRYYNNQDIHQVAVIDSDIVSGFDGDLLVLDASNAESIENNGLFVYAHNYGCKPSSNSRGFNNAKSSKEVVYYNYIPKEKILYVLNSLLVDMIYNDMLDLDIFNNKGYIYPVSLLSLSYINKYIDAKYKEVFQEIYINNKNIDLLFDYSYEDLIKIKKEFLNVLNNCNIKYVKKLTKDIRLPEEGERR